MLLGRPSMTAKEVEEQDRRLRERGPTPQPSPLHSPTTPTFGPPTLVINSVKDHVPQHGMCPPEITLDMVGTAPNTPVTTPTAGESRLRDGRRGGPPLMIDLRGLSHSACNIDPSSLTPTSSLLAVNRPIELRESTLTVNYPDMGGFVNWSRAFPSNTSLQSGSTVRYSKAHWARRCVSDFSLYEDYADDGDEVSLVYARHEKIPMKDFAAEVRASVDVEHFLHQAILLLDLADASMDGLLDKILHRLIDGEEPHITVEEAKRALYTHESVHKIAKTIQGTCMTYGGAVDFDQSWICILCTKPKVQKRHVAIARLKNPANFGRTCQEVYFIILVLAPSKEKGTKNALETGRTFATLFADVELRFQLLTVQTEEGFKRLLWQHTKELAEEQGQARKNEKEENDGQFEDGSQDKDKCPIARGLRRDLQRRLSCYVSDYVDGIVGHKTPQKTISTIFFLYFACILPSIAFGALNDKNTHGMIGVKKVVYSQFIGGICFALIGGQPMIILLTTAPLALFVKVIYKVCEDNGLDFDAMYACVGMWCSVFLLLCSLTDLCKITKWSTRSTEEIFSLFISIAFVVDAFRDIYSTFAKHYHGPRCHESEPNHVTDVATNSSPTLLNSTVRTIVATVINTTTEASDVSNATEHAIKSTLSECLRDTSLLHLLLVCGTLWLGVSLYNFTKTPFLNAGRRELLADYALPVAVIVMSFFGSYVFKDIKMAPFNYNDAAVFKPAPFHRLPWRAVLGAGGLGFCLSLLFFMDQNIASATVNSSLKKGPAYHWDLAVVAVLNMVLTYFGLSMLHGALPHSPLHVRAMADMEERVDQGHVYQRIVHVRETRITAIGSHILIGLSLFLLPHPLQYIPRPVLNGLFLYIAFTGLNHNQMFERVMLFFTEQAAYPPNHYIRSVPQRKVHLFTVTQLVQLAVMCAFGFSSLSYLKMCFPILLLLLLPIRHRLVPKIIPVKYLDALDGSN